MIDIKNHNLFDILIHLIHLNSQNGYSGPNCQTLPYIPPSNCNDIDPLNCPTYAALKYCTNTYSVNGVTIPNYCAKSCNNFKINNPLKQLNKINFFK